MMALALKRPPRFAPREYRQGVAFDTALILTDDRVIAVAVRNLSAQGFMGRSSVSLKPGGWVGVELPGYGIARALVRWCEDDEFGCQFRSPIDFGRLAGASAGAPAPSLFGRAAVTPASTCGSDRATA